MKNLALLLVPIVLAATCCSSSMFPLHRVQSRRRGDMEVATAHDRARSSHFLGRFPVEGSGVFSRAGLYYTRIKLGTPPKEFTVSIDTGSDLLWVSCIPCIGCPQYTGIGINLNFNLSFFDVTSSTTAIIPTCLNTTCGYNMSYVDGSQTSGFGVKDVLSLRSTSTASADHSVNVGFGCSTTRSGIIADPDTAADGIFGFGPGKISILSQLSAQGITPHVFSHCLKGDDMGGGFLVLGQVLHPKIQYSPMISSQPYYSLYLESITIRGQILPTGSMTVNGSAGINIDSGATFSYLPQDIHDLFTVAIHNAVSQFAHFRMEDGTICYIPTTRGTITFPSPVLTFAGGSTMTLRPQDYLFRKTSLEGGYSYMCLGILVVPDGGYAVLGEISLNDKIVVYDLHQNRIGWVEYDCRSSYNVSMSYGFGRSAGMQNIPALHIMGLVGFIIFWSFFHINV